MNSGIYKIRNIKNGKCYVGSAKNFDNRWKRHIKDLNLGKHSSIKLQRSFNVHGIDSFSFEIIESVEYTKDIIIEKENFWISKLDSKVNGYNIADASFGDVLTCHPNKEEIISKIRNAITHNINKMSIDERKEKFGKSKELNGTWIPELNRHCVVCGCTLSDSTKYRRGLNCGKCRDRSGECNPFYGKHHSKETKNTISEKIKGKPNINRRRKIVADGMEFNSRSECAKHFNISASLVTYRLKSEKYNWFDVNA